MTKARAARVLSRSAISVWRDSEPDVTDASSDATLVTRYYRHPGVYVARAVQPELGVDARADIYARERPYLMLGGKTPFTGDLMQLVMQKIMQKRRRFPRFGPIFGRRRASGHAGARDGPGEPPASVAEWISELEESRRRYRCEAGTSRLIVLAPVSAEVYINDESRGSIGSSGAVSC